MSATRRFGGRTLARSQALQLLFQADMLNESVEEVLAGPYALSQKDPLDEYGEFLARGADSMRHELDAVISRSSRHWSLERMPLVDRNLLRLTLFEMLRVDEVAIAVSIDESVELAKAYGTDESSRFINGLLGRVASELEAGRDVIAEALSVEAARQPADATDCATALDDAEVETEAASAGE